MVKLIVSDIDGTLLPYGQINLRPSLFQVIEQLRERGVIFCPASGRQYHSLRGLFAPVQDELAYLCENGAILYGAGREEDARYWARLLCRGRRLWLWQRTSWLCRAASCWCPALT